MKTEQSNVKSLTQIKDDVYGKPGTTPEMSLILNWIHSKWVVNPPDKRSQAYDSARTR
jgi:hypothetical protein